MTTEVTTVWASVEDACRSRQHELDEATVALLSDQLLVASDLLFNLTGRRWNGGGATHTYRPDPQERCWRNSASMLRLPRFPATSITSVKVDGATVAAGRYRIDDRRWLVYVPATDGTETLGGWPSVQRLDLPSTAQGTWEVTYVYGAAPPRGGAAAAASLAVELALSCQGKKTRLPSRVTSLTRQGVTLAVLDPLTLFDDGKTGVAEVDMWVANVNLAARRGHPTVWIPGKRRGVTPA